MLPLLLLLAACEAGDGAEPAQAAEDSEGAAPQAEDEATRGPGRPPGPTTPLAGLPVAEAVAEAGDAKVVLRQPVLGVKLGNDPAARPQEGLEDAEIVFVTPVEGGGTGLAALYHTTLPERAGPVGPGYQADADLLAGFDPVLAYAGADPGVLETLRASGISLREDGQPLAAWRRDPARRAPHNLFASPAALTAQHPGLRPAARPWRISAQPSAAGGEGVAGVRLRYSALHEAEWRWDRDGRRWVRSQDGAHHTAADGTRVAAANVVVARVEGGGVDLVGRGDPGGGHRFEAGGEAHVLRGGEMIDARWERQPNGRFTWLDSDGQPLELLPGRTWVELLPAQGRVEALPATVG